VLAVARQEHQKGLDVLLRALPLVRRGAPTARLLVAGREGSQTPRLREIVRDLSLNDAVTFLGAREDVPDLLCAADAFVLPSRREGLPGSVIEAMALEVPIVASDLPQVRELVNEASALLVPPGSPESLAIQLERLLGDPDEPAGRVQRAAAVFRDRFTVERVVDQMRAFYVRALGNSR
jgi:glycosyltransferase involved in cell wall biosynthesis